MNNAPMKRPALLFLQAIIIVIGIGTIVFMLWEPTVEGVNVNATFLQIYFDDPFLAYVYLASIPFFVALYQAFTLLKYMGQNNLVSLKSLRAVRTIRYCALALLASVAGAEAFIVMTRSGKDDIAGGVAMGVFAALLFITMFTAATLFERRLQRTVLR
jgi:Protein of unknown function (DUF2975)